jgi:hypothetical protein
MCVLEGKDSGSGLESKLTYGGLVTVTVVPRGEAVSMELIRWQAVVAEDSPGAQAFRTLEIVIIGIISVGVAWAGTAIVIDKSSKRPFLRTNDEFLITAQGGGYGSRRVIGCDDSCDNRWRWCHQWL